MDAVVFGDSDRPARYQYSSLQLEKNVDRKRTETNPNHRTGEKLAVDLPHETVTVMSVGLEASDVVIAIVLTPAAIAVNAI